MQHNCMNTLAAHGEDLFRSEGVKASIRAELRLDLKLNKDGTRLLSLPISHIRNSSSRTATATWKGFPPSGERKIVGSIHHN